MSRRWFVIGMFAAACALPSAAPALAAEVQIGGRVLLPGGTPFSKAEVTLVPLTDALTDARRVLDGVEVEPVAHAVTDDQGRFQLTAPSAGLWRVRVGAPGFVTLETELTPLIEPAELPDAEIEPDAGLNVRVVDPDGKPVQGARVQVTTDRPSMRFGRPSWTYPARRGITDAEGHLRLERAERERVGVDVYAPGLAWYQRRGLFGTAAAVKLQRGTARSIEVRSKAGQPQGGVVVSLGNDPLSVARTGADGRASLTLDPKKEAPIKLLADDGRRLEARLTVRKTADAGKPQGLTLPDTSAVSGRLIDARSRRPVSGGLVWDSENPLFSAVADDQGGFALAGPAGSRLRITAGAPGYLNADPREFQLADDGRPGPTLVLSPAAAIEGKVTDADGQPVSGAEVELRVKRTPGRMRIEIGGPTLAPRAITNARGKFRLSPIDPDGTYTVHTQAEGYAPGDDDAGQLEPYKTRSDMRILLTRGQSIRGTVVDGSGHGLADATIKLSAAAAGGGAGMMRVVNPGDLAAAFEATSEADGTFVVTGLPAGKFDVEASCRGFARTKLSAVEVAREPVDLGEVTLAAGETIQGIVVDGDGRPVEGVEVFAKEAGPMMMMMMGPMRGPDNKIEPDAVTDPAGWFQVSDLGTKQPYDLNFNRTGYVGKSQSGVQLPRVEPLEITMDAASRVVGTVLDAQGEPIPGAKVDMTRSKTIEMGGAAMQMVMKSSETTDAEGRFVFEDQEPGEISLSAVASGSQEAKLQSLVIPRGEDLTGIEIPLPAGAIVEGRVLTPDGRAAIGATVNPVTESPQNMARFGGTPTDGEGYFRIEGLAPGKASVEAEHKDYPRVVRDLELKEGINGLTLNFEGGQSVSGRVSDDQGNPVGGAGVRLASAGRYWGGPETTTGADGTFEMPGVQDGDYTVTAEAEGFAGSARDRQVKVAGSPVAGIEIQLSRGGTISGSVSGIDPEKFSRVSVSAEGRGFGGFGGARVDYQGNYRIEHVAPGDYTVVASVANSGLQARQPAVVEAGTPEVRVDLRFAGGLTLSGQALQGDEPVSGAMVYTSGIDIEHDGWGQTDTDGRFSIEGLEAGRYKVQLQHWQTGLSYTEELEVGSSREIVLKVPTAAVTGRVLDASDSQPLAGVTVVLEPTEGATDSFRPAHAGTTDLEGKFILDSVGDGNWRLKASKQGYAAQTRTVNVQFQKGPADVRLSMDPTEGLTLEARLPSGGVPGELQVAVLDGSGAALTSGTYATGENGRVRLSSVPPGSWELIVSGAGSAVSSLRAEAPGATVAVALQPACTLRVRVPELAESGAVGMVRLSDASGRPFRSLGWSGAPRSEWRMSGGTMDFASLPPGSWTVSVAAGEGQAWQATATTNPSAPAEVIMDR